MGSQQPNWRYPSSSDAEFLQNEREKTVHKRYDELMAVYKAGDKQRAKLLAQALLREERDLPRFIFSKTCLIIALVADDWQEAENFYQNALHSYEMALGVVKRNGAYGACEHIRDIYDALDKHLKRFGPVHAARKPGEGREAAITAGPRVISAPQDSDEEL
ncbi:hypothetical protein EJ06DRAFT_557970 [Trichodelitschia bisporula]|uniref:TPR-like protein n=1 Tax=Trichodelitschia bisporula TaxID=703511 RepID=A0A6G1HRV2_9PEZI|nr:hypothetical protein EJ06DRAFT_557970 [Trichodelitschia bisporula]